ncbi:hypothetical protein JCM1393_27370 [Clostridium carnis]
MKKYLNKSLYFQGDKNIFIFLMVLYINTFIILNLIIAKWFRNFSKQILYTYKNIYFQSIFAYGTIFILILFLFINFLIVAGLHKRKKWSTLLSGPFRRKDIRIREIIIMLISILVFIGIYLVIIAREAIIYKDILKYTTVFNTIIVIDILKIVSISLIVIGSLFFIDNIFSNVLFLTGGIIFGFMYFFALFYNLFNNIFYSKFMDNIYLFINYILDFIGGNIILNLNIGYNIIISLGFIFIGIILLVSSVKMTKYMKVENMGDGIIFNFSKKIFKIMICTFIGLVLSPLIISLIESEFLYYTLDGVQLFVYRFIIISISSLITYLVLKRIEKKLKKCWLIN